jgi:endogenous inhibitor of DNA gyrase (YacG/DUF329 family)
MVCLRCSEEVILSDGSHTVNCLLKEGETCPECGDYLSDENESSALDYCVEQEKVLNKEDEKHECSICGKKLTDEEWKDHSHSDSRRLGLDEVEDQEKQFWDE